MITTDPAPWIEFFGRLHLMVLHAPIGLLIGLAILEFGAVLRHKVESPGGTLLLVWLTACSAALAAGTGYILGSADSDRSWTLTTHQTLGIAVAASCLLMAILRSVLRQNARPYRMILLLTLVLAVPTGHLGATMTHGEQYLTEPFTRRAATASRIPAQTRPSAESPSASADAAAGEPTTAEPGTAEAAPRQSPSAAQAASVPQPALVDVFATGIAPVLADRCGNCHGESRHKGGLALHTADSVLAGGKSGPILVAGQPEESELVRRVRLPLDDLDHMPPEGKPQLTEDEIRAIEQWIAEGATFGPAPVKRPSPVARLTANSASATTASPSPVVSARPAGPTAPAEPQSEAQAPDSAKPTPQAEPTVRVTPAASTEPRTEAVTPAPKERTAGDPLPDPTAVAALRDSLVHVEAIEAGSNRLRINFAAASAKTDDAAAGELLKPVLGHVETLAIARCAIGDETARLLGGAEHLRQLDLRGTKVTDVGLAALAKLEHLEELVVAQTHLTDAAVEHLAAIPALRRLYVWGSGLSTDAITHLREKRPELFIDSGDFAEAAAAEVEPDIKLTSDAPLPGQPATTTTSLVSLTPINTTCPVSGGSLDPRYAIVHKNRVIGFCCQNCPVQFWADPAKFESKLPPAVEPEPTKVAGD